MVDAGTIKLSALSHKELVDLDMHPLVRATFSCSLCLCTCLHDKLAYELHVHIVIVMSASAAG